jgi:hypothetical protein
MTLNSVSAHNPDSARRTTSLATPNVSRGETPWASIPSNECVLPTESPASIFTDFENSYEVYSRRKVRETAMKSSLAFLSLLLFATCAQAQHSHLFSSGSNFNQGGGYGGGYSGGWDGYGAGGYGYGYGSGGSHHHGGLRYEPPREFSTGSVTNDGPYVPSTFMTFEEALALAKQQLAAGANPAQTDTGPSLGDVARAYRAAKSSAQPPPTLALQDNTGRLHICNLNGDSCRQP